MNKEIIEYDDRDNLVHYKGNYNNEAWSIYDENNNLIHIKDSDDYEYWYKYDKNNRIEITQQEFKRIERTKLYFNIKRSNRFEIMDI